MPFDVNETIELSSEISTTVPLSIPLNKYLITKKITLTLEYNIDGLSEEEVKHEIKLKTPRIRYNIFWGNDYYKDTSIGAVQYENNDIRHYFDIKDKVFKQTFYVSQRATDVGFMFYQIYDYKDNNITGASLTVTNAEIDYESNQVFFCPETNFMLMMIFAKKKVESLLM